MADPKIIFLAPVCEESNGEREWCEDDAWEACACGTSSTRYNLGEDFDRVLAERDALQLRLNDIEDENDRLRSVVRFYADKNHISDDMRADWDVVSGEPLNILWHEEEPWFVEDGSIAKRALEAKQ